MKILEIKNVSKRFGGLRALDNCTIDVEEGEILGLIGPNGSGKTTLFNVITGLRCDKGNVFYKNEEITKWHTHDIARSGVSRTFQLIRLFPKLTVMENMLIAMKYIHGEHFWPQLIKKKHVIDEERSAVARAKELLKIVNLDEKADELAENISYGQQKLLEIARALATEPKLLLLDEPVAGVNPTLAKQILLLIKDLNKKGMTIVIVEHNMNVVMNICSRIVVLENGKEIATGAPAQIRKNERVIEAYLGRG